MGPFLRSTLISATIHSDKIIGDSFGSRGSSAVFFSVEDLSDERNQEAE